MAKPGNTVYLVCHSTSVVEWSKGGNILGNQPILRLISLTVEYQGVYKCSVGEGANKVSQESVLLVTGNYFIKDNH